MFNFLLRHGIYGKVPGILFTVICLISIAAAGFFVFSALRMSRSQWRHNFWQKLGIAVLLAAVAAATLPLGELMFWQDGSGIIYADDYSVLASFDGPHRLDTIEVGTEYAFSWIEDGKIQEVTAMIYYAEEDGSLAIFTEEDGVSDSATELINSSFDTVN